jgi:hypothetical protein
MPEFPWTALGYVWSFTQNIRYNVQWRISIVLSAARCVFDELRKRADNMAQRCIAIISSLMYVAADTSTSPVITVTDMGICVEVPANTSSDQTCPAYGALIAI